MSEVKKGLGLKGLIDAGVKVVSDALHVEHIKKVAHDVLGTRAPDEYRSVDNNKAFHILGSGYAFKNMQFNFAAPGLEKEPGSWRIGNDYNMFGYATVDDSLYLFPDQYRKKDADHDMTFSIDLVRATQDSEYAVRLVEAAAGSLLIMGMSYLFKHLDKKSDAGIDYKAVSNIDPSLP